MKRIGANIFFHERLWAEQQFLLRIKEMISTTYNEHFSEPTQGEYFFGKLSK
jgi:hypothetical protein